MIQEFILVVDDDINLRQSIALVLRRAGYPVTTADNASEALEYIRSGNYGLVILDARMPDTLTVMLPGLSYSDPFLCIILLTDPPLPSFARKDKLPNLHFLAKPIAPENLLNDIQSILLSKHWKETKIKVSSQTS